MYAKANLEFPPPPDQFMPLHHEGLCIRPSVLLNFLEQTKLKRFSNGNGGDDEICVELSQCGSRMHFQTGCANCCMPKQIQYFVRDQYCMLGVEALQLQGIPFRWQCHNKGISDRKNLTLAGNSFNMVVVMKVLLALSSVDYASMGMVL